jgi:hypothetical protein
MDVRFIAYNKNSDNNIPITATLNVSKKGARTAHREPAHAGEWCAKRKQFIFCGSEGHTFAYAQRLATRKHLWRGVQALQHSTPHP